MDSRIDARLSAERCPAEERRRRLEHGLRDGLDERLGQEARVRLRLRLERRPQRVAFGAAVDRRRAKSEPRHRAVDARKPHRLDPREARDELREREDAEEAEHARGDREVRRVRRREEEGVGRLREHEDAERGEAEAGAALEEELGGDRGVEDDILGWRIRRQELRRIARKNCAAAHGDGRRRGDHVVEHVERGEREEVGAERFEAVGEVGARGRAHGGLGRRNHHRPRRQSTSS